MNFIDTLGWTLLHFIWQGTAIALLLAAAEACVRSRSAQLRYALACGAMLLMVASIGVTFLWLASEPAPARSFAATARSAAASPLISRTVHALAAAPARFSAWMPIFVSLWFAGVCAMAIRSIGGWFVAQRFRRTGTIPADDLWQQRLRTLAHRLRVSRPIRLCHSTLAEVPAVIGWLRPVVLLPASMLSGLTPRQIEALLAHELAHVRRHDYLINLIQTVVETLLFYHPAVWWTGRLMRAEREHCCDDMAVEVCGDALIYARALTRMEQLRAQRPALALGADGGSLLKRIQRLLSSRDSETAGASDWVAAVGVMLCAAAIWAAPHLPFANGAHVQRLRARTAVERAFPAVFRAERVFRAEHMVRAARPVLAAFVAQATSEPAPQGRVTGGVSGSVSGGVSEGVSGGVTGGVNQHGFISDMDAAGYRNLSVDDLISLKQHGVTPEFVRRIQAAGYKPDVDELVAMAIHGVTPEYIAEMNAQGFKLDIDQLVAFKIHGVEPSTIAAIRAMGYKPDADDVVAMQIHGVTPEMVRGMKALGIGVPTLDELVALQIHGITPEYANQFKALGVKDLDFDALITLKIHGAEPSAVREIEQLGFNNLDADDIVDLYIHGVTPDYIRKARQHGFKDLTLDQIVKLKQFGILE